MKNSSNWSITTSTADSSSGSTRRTERNRPPSSASWSPNEAGGLTATRTSAVSSVAIGSGPGTIVVTNHDSEPGTAPRRNAGINPARTTDDLPDPDGPTTGSDGDPEVGEIRRTVLVPEQVCRADIAVQYADPMGRVQRAPHFFEDAGELVA